MSLEAMMSAGRKQGGGMETRFSPHPPKTPKASPSEALGFTRDSGMVLSNVFLCIFTFVRVRQSSLDSHLRSSAVLLTSTESPLTFLGL